MNKYYFVVKNNNDDNLAIFEDIEDAISWMESRYAILIETYRIQVMPKK